MQYARGFFFLFSSVSIARENLCRVTVKADRGNIALRSFQSIERMPIHRHLSVDIFGESTAGINITLLSEWTQPGGYQLPKPHWPVVKWILNGDFDWMSAQVANDLSCSGNGIRDGERREKGSWETGVEPNAAKAGEKERNRTRRRKQKSRSFPHFLFFLNSVLWLMVFFWAAWLC